MTDLLETASDGVATLTMNRPERRNAMSSDMLDALLEALTRLGADDDVGAIILTGTGEAFCAGGDVKAMAAGGAERTLEQRTRGLRHVMESARLLHEVPKPTIARIRGAAAGAGLSLALACDMRFVSENAKFTTAFANVALSGDFGGSYFLSKLVGTAKARELYFGAELIRAEEAARIGMVNRVLPDAELDQVTQRFAVRLAAGPRITLAYMKRNMNAAESETLAQCLDLEALHHSRCAMTEDHREAAAAFVEKRTPLFQGR